MVGRLQTFVLLWIITNWCRRQSIQVNCDTIPKNESICTIKMHKIFNKLNIWTQLLEICVKLDKWKRVGGGFVKTWLMWPYLLRLGVGNKFFIELYGYCWCLIVLINLNQKLQFKFTEPRICWGKFSYEWWSVWSDLSIVCEYF